MSNFPGGLDVFTTKTDGIDKYNAADMNAVQSAALALQIGGASQQTVTETVLVSGVDPTLGQTVFVTLTANRVVGAPIGTPTAGRRIHYIFTENGTGGWTLTFNAIFSLTNWALNTAANARTELTVEYDATASKWVFASNPPIPKTVYVGTASGVDDTALINAAIATAMTTNAGGTVVLTDEVTKYVCLGALSIPFTGPSTLPVQVPLRITSISGPGWSGYWPTSAVNGGVILDLRYAGGDGFGHVAKIDTRGAGFLEIDHLSLVSGGSDNYPFLQTTNTTVKIHDNLIQGNLANQGVTCVQDAIIFGGTGTTVGNGANAPFQGYGSSVNDNYFDHIRRGFLGQTYCNNAFVQRNTFSITCGAASGSFGAIELVGLVTPNTVNGNVIRDNLIEVPSYYIAIRLTNARDNLIEGNSFWDGSGTIGVACVSFGPGCTGNYALCGFNGQSNGGGGVLFGTEDATVVGTNTIIEVGHSNKVFQIPAPLTITGSGTGIVISNGGLVLSGTAQTIKLTDGTKFKWLRAFADQFAVMNSAATVGVLTVDDTGNLVSAGSITATAGNIKATSGDITMAGNNVLSQTGAFPLYLQTSQTQPIILRIAAAEQARVDSNGDVLLKRGVGFWNHAGVAAQPTAIAAPTAPSAGYVQAEAQSMKTAVDAIRAALSGSGFTA